MAPLTEAVTASAPKATAQWFATSSRTTSRKVSLSRGMCGVVRRKGSESRANGGEFWWRELQQLKPLCFSRQNAGLHISESDFLLIRQNCDLNDFVFWRDSKQGADCLAGNGTLPSPLSGPSCAPGYLCAFAMELCNMYTWPQYCAPTVDCAIDMLQYQFCDAQNANQPMLCEAGHVCSVRTSYEMAEPQTQRRCPSGSYCVIGTSEPVDCGWMTYCKEGSDHPKQWGAFLLMAIADVCLFLIWRARRNRIVLQQQQVSAKAATRSSELQGSSSGVLMEPLLMDAETKEEGPAVAGDPIHTLVKGFVRVRGSLFSLDFAFDDLGLQLPNGTRILQSVSGRVTPAKVTAIMGPSGAGKTTMLHVLMGKVPPTFQRSGTLRINGKVTSMSAYKRSIGYVPQEDIMHRSLTVRDNIEYSARVRLPDDWTEEELMHHVDATLDVLQLSHVQHTVIGDERIRGVSGGQRKRVNIGMEVVAAPVALFLDEPTSGLDATAALTVTESLEQIAHAAGITVAMVVHQPRYEIWQSLDEVFFLGPGGRTVFLGAQKDVESYFLTQLRVQPTPKDNPADFFMDLICERGQECVEAWEEHVAQHPTAALGSQRISSVKSSSYEGITETDMQIDEPNQPLRGESGMPDVAELAELLRSGGAYGDVELQARLLLEINEEQICAAAAKGGVMKTRVSLAGLLSEITGTRRGADFFTQTRLAHNRSIKQQLNDSTGILIELVTISFAGLLMGFASKFVFEGILEVSPAAALCGSILQLQLTPTATRLNLVGAVHPAFAFQSSCHCPADGHVRGHGGGPGRGSAGREHVRPGARHLLARSGRGPQQAGVLHWKIVLDDVSHCALLAALRSPLPDPVRAGGHHRRALHRDVRRLLRGVRPRVHRVRDHPDPDRVAGRRGGGVDRAGLWRIREEPAGRDEEDFVRVVGE
eukprot:scaffold4746_cov248-Pinguiococcus_pyrenoidosus.AAC.2